MQVGRNRLCPCGSGAKYKKCCLSKEKSSGKPSRDEDAVAVFMATRGQISFETHMALTYNMSGFKHVETIVARKPIVDARNALAHSSLSLRADNPLDFIPREWFVLWVDDDAWWRAGTVEVMLRALREYSHVDALFGNFSSRTPYSHALAWRSRHDNESYPKPGVDCSPGDVVSIERAGFHFVLMRLSLLERIGKDPFTVPDGEEIGEDFAFCDRAKFVGANLAVGMGMPIVHVDARNGAAYIPGMPAMMMDGNSVKALTVEHGVPGGRIRAEARKYGLRVDQSSEDILKQEKLMLDEMQRRLELGGIET